MNGVLSITDTDKAESLCKYFSGVGVTDDGKISSCSFNTNVDKSDIIDASLSVLYFDFYSVLSFIQCLSY